jgi:hypothetical protein
MPPITIFQGTPECFIAAAVVTNSIAGKHLVIQYDEKDKNYNLKKFNDNKTVKMDSSTQVTIIGDVGLDKLIKQVIDKVASVTIFSHKDSDSANALLSKKKDSKVYTADYLPILILNTLSCQLAPDHSLRKLSIEYAKVDQNNNLDDPLCRGVDEVISEIFDYDLDAQMEMLTATKFNSIIKIGEGIVAMDNSIVIWKSFGYESDSDSESESESESPSPPPKKNSKNRKSPPNPKQEKKNTNTKKNK